MRVRVLASAAADIAGIGHGPAAKRFLATLRPRLKNLGKVPDSGRMWTSPEMPIGVRSILVGDYYVFYQVTSAVEIMHVIHQSRDIPSLF